MPMLVVRKARFKIFRRGRVAKLSLKRWMPILDVVRPGGSTSYICNLWYFLTIQDRHNRVAGHGIEVLQSHIRDRFMSLMTPTKSRHHRDYRHSRPHDFFLHIILPTDTRAS